MENSPAPEITFQQQIARYKKAVKETEARLIRLSWLRLALFTAGAVLEWMSWSWGGIWWLVVLVGFLAGFGALIRRYVKVEGEKKFQQTLKDINQEELDRLNHKLDGLNGGEEFADRTHSYSSDLDLYGEKSLFAYLSRATSVFGRGQLSRWLNQYGKREEILARQEAASELAGKLDWRQQLQATGRMFEDPGEDPETLRAWVTATPEVLPKPIYRWVPLLLPPIALCLIVAAFAGWVPFYVALAWVAIHGIINWQTINKISGRAFEETSHRAKILKSYAGLISRIEAESMNSALPIALQQRLKTDGTPAHAEITRLAKILTNMELRLNGMPYFVMQFLFFWDMIWIRKLEQWKQRHGQSIMDWFAVIGEFEALSSLAAVEFAHPEWTLPEIPASGYMLEGEDLGHPMLPVDECVQNPVMIPRPGLIWLITGSNMSGKSTYLRTVGINSVLALAGARVCAKSFKITPMQVLTSMRTLDSLEENTSSFYAELKRLKLVIESVASGKPVFFLLDEILKGTNSRDRHAGARALIKQLQAKGGSGMVSTHDLELVNMADQMPNDIINYSFNCEVSESGDLNFDYTLTDGMCLSMNATQLMKAMGIEM
jgi:hypothetical protein